MGTELLVCKDNDSQRVANKAYQYDEYGAHDVDFLSKDKHAGRAQLTSAPLWRGCVHFHLFFCVRECNIRINLLIDTCS